MDLILGYAAGLLTLINPCVVPVLPIVLASSLQASRAGPIALAAGMSVSFVVLGLFVASLGPALGIFDDTISQIAAIFMVAFGLILLVPRFSAVFATATAGVSAQADQGVGAVTANGAGVTGQFLGGLLMGAVWSPCIGPTLGAAIALASQGESLLRAGAVMLSFALGVSTLIIGIAYVARSALQRNQALMQRIATRSRPILGLVFVLVGIGIYFRLHHAIEIWALQNLPPWLIDLSVSL